MDLGRTLESGRLSRVGILRPLRIRDFALLWAGATVSLIGDGVYVVALAWQVYALSDSPTALSLVGVAWTLPLGLFVLLGGVISDRFERRRIMIAADVVAGRGGHDHRRALAHGCDRALAPDRPRRRVRHRRGVLRPRVHRRSCRRSCRATCCCRRTRSTSSSGRSRSCSSAPRWAGGSWRHRGPARHSSSTPSPSSLGDGDLPHPPPAARSSVSSRRPATSVLRELREGLAFVRAHTWLWATLVAAAVFLLAYWGPVEVLVPYLVRNELGGDADDFGLVLACGGVGSILAALFLGQRGLPRRHITFMYLRVDDRLARARRLRARGRRLAAAGDQPPRGHVLHGRHRRLGDARADARPQRAARARHEPRLVRLHEPGPHLLRADRADVSGARRADDLDRGRHRRRGRHDRVPVRPGVRDTERDGSMRDVPGAELDGSASRGRSRASRPGRSGDAWPRRCRPGGSTRPRPRSRA